jgi:hypothetical protein
MARFYERPARRHRHVIYLLMCSLNAGEFCIFYSPREKKAPGMMSHNLTDYLHSLGGISYNVNKAVMKKLAKISRRPYPWRISYAQLQVLWYWVFIDLNLPLKTI